MARQQLGTLRTAPWHELERWGVWHAQRRYVAAACLTRQSRIPRKNPQTEVQLRADKTVPYGRVAELIGIVQKAGLTRIGFVAEPASASPP